MANADGCLFNVDRWSIYTLQKVYNGRVPRRQSPYYGEMVPFTPRQLRRVVKKARARNDWSIGVWDLEGVKKPGPTPKRKVKRGK